MSKFCFNCGFTMPDEAGFCPACGTRMPVGQVQNNQPYASENTPVYMREVELPPPQSSVPQTPVQPDYMSFGQQSNPFQPPVYPVQQKQKKPFNLVAILAVAVAVIVALGIGAAVFGGKGPEKNPEVPTDSNGNVVADITQAEVYPEEVPERTVMIYVVGSDLESDAGAATLDFAEIMNADVDPEKTNILVYTGGATKWDNKYVYADENAVFSVENGNFTKVQTYPQNNMGISTTLTEFLNYGISDYPADEYSVILWNHGAGPLEGYGYDLNTRDILTMDEMVKAFEDVNLNGEKFELIGFDACLMGSIETAWCLRDYADYMVFSQESEPGYGWDYGFLAEADSCYTGEELGKVIVDKYFEFYEDMPYVGNELTLSCVKLSEIGTVEDCINSLFGEVSDNILAGGFAKASRCRNNTKAFGKAGNVEYDLVDLGHLVSLLSVEHGEKADKLTQALEKFVCYSRSNVTNANGVSIYHPYSNKTYISAWMSTFKTFGFADEYTAYLETFVAELNGNPQSDIWSGFSKSSATVETSGNVNELQFKLTPEQAANYSNATVYIFRELDEDQTFSKQKEYQRIYYAEDVSIDENGVVSASYDGKAIFGYEQLGDTERSDSPLVLKQYNDGGTPKYYLEVVFMRFPENMADYDADTDTIRAKWFVTIENGVAKLGEVYPDEETESVFASRKTIDPREYEYVQIASGSYFITEDENGNPSFEWTGNIYGYEYEMKNSFAVETGDIKNKEDYYFVFRVEDVYGNVYFSRVQNLADAG